MRLYETITEKIKIYLKFERVLKKFTAVFLQLKQILENPI